MSYILLVEPDDEFAAVIERYFKKNKIDIIHCATSQSAIIQADKRRPRAIILELAIPAHNGLAFLHEFRSYPDWSGVPIIIYSHLPLESTGLSKAAWQKQGVADYLYKPTSRLNELNQALENVMWAHRA